MHLIRLDSIMSLWKLICLLFYKVRHILTLTTAIIIIKHDAFFFGNTRAAVRNSRFVLFVGWLVWGCEWLCVWESVMLQFLCYKGYMRLFWWCDQFSQYVISLAKFEARDECHVDGDVDRGKKKATAKETNGKSALILQVVQLEYAESVLTHSHAESNRLWYAKKNENQRLTSAHNCAGCCCCWAFFTQYMCGTYFVSSPFFPLLLHKCDKYMCVEIITSDGALNSGAFEGPSHWSHLTFSAAIISISNQSNQMGFQTMITYTHRFLRFLTLYFTI